MSPNLKTDRVVCKPERDEEYMVLRLAREPLRQDPPRVQFIGRSDRDSAQGALPWRASA
jgi:hypothetical protein